LKKWQVAALFAAGLTLGGTVVWLITRSSDSSPHAAPTAPARVHTTTATPGVATNAQELLDRLDSASKATFHVRYTTGSASGSHAVLDVWHTADRVRRDIVAVSPTEGTAHTAEILAGGKFVRCVLFAGKPWQCVGAPVAASGSLTDPLQGAEHDVVGRKVTVSRDVIAGQPVQCYTVAAGDTSGKPSEFCLSRDNVPLRIQGSDGDPVNATNYDRTVPDSVFTPPAAVAGS
jgi:hypothetical protein